VRRSDDNDTDVRQLGIILQLTDEGYCKEKGFANDIDVGQLSTMQKSNGTTRQYKTMVQRGMTQHHTTRHYATINLMRLGMVQGELSCRGLVNEA
jgi:hypothetical protein